MKKLHLLILIIFSAVFVFCVYVYVNVWTSEGVDITHSQKNNSNSTGVASPPSLSTVSQDNLFQLGVLSDHEANSRDEAIKSIKPGITLLPLSEQIIPKELRDQFNKDLENLKKMGSMSGGVLTDQFSRVDDLSSRLLSKGLPSIQQGLAINPTNLQQLLGNTFVLVGADTQAKYINDLGWTGYFQIFFNNQSKQMVELSENQFDTAAGDGVQQASDFINSRVLNYPAVFQYIKLNASSYLYEFQWFVGDRVFMLTTKNLSQQEAQSIAENITRAHLLMPNKGWKNPM